MDIENVIILGSGPAGLTAAIYAARAGLSPVVISGETLGGQLTQTNSIENWPGIPTSSGFDLMKKMIDHAESLNVKMISDSIVSANLTNTPFTLQGQNKTYQAKTIIVATGAGPKKLGIPSEKEFMANGVSFCATCDGYFYRGKDVAVIGGGNTALVDALYLAGICHKVYLIHRRQDFRAETVMIKKVAEAQKAGKIETVLDAVTDEILGSKENGVNGIRVRFRNGYTKEISVNGIFVAIGHVPNSSLFDGQLVMEEGTIKTGLDPLFQTASSIPGVFAAGDVADRLYRQAITSAGAGCRAALDAERFLKLKY